ncbi:MAG: NADH-ubiquinone oxidoreductase-F iron-sulfur binding region domain-containing protein [Dehalococcoidales bacterium]|nr:NADH-ubiquinone oxidoreductase-F iron-sulfur binding region domain-containing protein [Dehalococcoidales bacterium]
MPEKRIILKNCGLIDPKEINTSLAQDGFKALTKALTEMTPEQVIEEIKASGLRGRGGAGFPCGLKWELTRSAAGNEKYLICNADEGEVGTFKDRYIIENDPFSLIEGIAIAAYAIGVKQAYIYLRAEYHFLLDQLSNAISQAREKGFLEHVDIEIREGAGAYIAGEESGLMNSIEGGRVEARYKPPFPPTEGLWQKPTSINNVETLMNIPRIILNGADWFNQIGTERSKGTKVFSVSGDVAMPGVYELVLGTPLRELVMELARAKNVKLLQIGGASGRIIPGTMLDTPLSFETMLGAGAIIVFDESRDVIDIVSRTMEFFAEESCGKCSPCREGTVAMVKIMERFAGGGAAERDIKLLEELSSAMVLTSLCGLGQAAPTPVTDSLQHFRRAYEERIQEAKVVKQ